MTRLLLAGGGHAHVEVLRRFAQRGVPDVDATLVTPAPGLLYSGMVPGVIAGAYTRAAATIDLAALARAAHTRLVLGSVCALDPARQSATLADGATVGFDIASLDVGAGTTMPAVRDSGRAIPVRPLAGLLDAWTAMREDAAVVVVGGGAAGVELAFAVAEGLAQGAAAPRVAIITDQREVAASHRPSVRRRLARLLAARGIDVIVGSTVRIIDTGAVQLADGRRIAADHAIVATPAAAPPWLRSSGLACDDAGFVQIDAHLRSVSHPAVFAAGDCAIQVGAPRPRSGVFAVRAGPPLADNLCRALTGRPLVEHHPQRTAMALISVGSGHAVLSRPPFAAEGAWVWRWKDRIDRAFVARYRIGN